MKNTTCGGIYKEKKTFKIKFHKPQAFVCLYAIVASKSASKKILNI